MKQLLPIVVALILIGCGTPMSEPTATSTSVPTPTTEPTNTPEPTAIPLSKIDLEPVLIQEYDLPAGYSGAQIRTKPHGIFEEYTQPSLVQYVYQQLELNGETGGYIVVWIYEEITDVKKTHLVSADGFIDEEETSDVGEAAMVSSFGVGLPIKGALISFTRCHVVVNIEFLDTMNTDLVIAYAQRLDERLTPLVCSE